MEKHRARRVKMIQQIALNNALNVNLIGLKQLDVIMQNVKYAIINFAINVEDLIVDHTNVIVRKNNDFQY